MMYAVQSMRYPKTTTSVTTDSPIHHLPCAKHQYGRQSLSPVFQSPELPCTLEPLSSKLDASQSRSSELRTHRIRRAESDDDMYWSGPSFWSDGTVHAARTASMTAPRLTSASVTPLKPATFPYLKSDRLAGYPVAGAHSTPIAAPN